MNRHQLYKFGPFSLDATAKVLLREGQAVSMTRKAVETLLVLVENEGQVVSKEEMLRAIWPDRVVDEANLTQNIAMVRRALGVEAGSPAFIETFPGRGYRLKGPVHLEQPEPDPPVVSEPAPPAEAPISHEVPPARGFGGRMLAIWLGIAIAGGLAVVAGWFWLLRSPQALRTVDAAFRVTPLTRLPGEERQPVLSPDGTRLAFLWQQADGHPPTLCLQTVGESSHQQLIEEEGNYSSPAWSPDGRALAFIRTDRTATEIRIRSLESRETRVVTRFTPPTYGIQRRFLDWSPDGQSLVVSTAGSATRPNGLFLVAVATGEKRRLTEPEAMVGGDTDPRFSPDGRRIAFIRSIHRSHQEVLTIPVTGGAPSPLTADSARISSLDWTTEGRIVFASDRDGAYRLWRLRAEGPAPEKEPQPIGVYGEFPMEVAMARQTPLLVYSIQPQNRNIWRLDLKEKRWTRIIASSAQDASPQYSPAGDQICFRSDRTGEEQLWVSALDGAQQVQVTRGALFPSVGHWSPDGRQIVFNNARTGELFVTSRAADGTWAVRPLGARGVHPVFSPDGRWIYAGSTRSLFRLPAAGGTPTDILASGGFSLGLSRDGKRLYFMRELNDTTLWRVDIETGALSEALHGLIPNCTSCWALADDGIYFLGSSKDSFDSQAIYLRDFATGAVREVVKYPEPIAPVGSGPFSLSGDRRHLLCVRIDPSDSDILRVEPVR
ncbi:MAG: LpqB family beta-propeller domain-containing protein [Blastocatellia bacterium]|nr:LpqB family beta-propeller domain-containing protein [Blastocatellia bacterium]